MNAITKTMSVAVLIALGLTLALGAAEPPKAAAPVDLDKLVGPPADLTEWAYVYRRGAADNPPEAEWLWPGKYMHWQQKWRGPACSTSPRMKCT